LKAVKGRLARGAIEVLVKRQSLAAAATIPVVDLPLAREYHEALRLISKELSLPDDISVHEIAVQPGVIRLQDKPLNLETLSASVDQALLAAVDELLRMRETEGAAIQSELDLRLRLVEQVAKEIEALAP